jgi:HEAT repeat protein
MRVGHWEQLVRENFRTPNLPPIKGAIPALIQALNDADEWVRVNAASALEEIGEPASSAAPALIQALNDADELVRVYAGRALGAIG